MELCGLAKNIVSFKHLLQKQDIDAVGGNLALVYILKFKQKLLILRIKRLLEVQIVYSFNLYYMKGKDMFLSDFLFRFPYDDSDPHGIIPVSFNMLEILKMRYHNIHIPEIREIYVTD